MVKTIPISGGTKPAAATSETPMTISDASFSKMTSDQKLEALRKLSMQIYKCACDEEEPVPAPDDPSGDGDLLDDDCCEEILKIVRSWKGPMSQLANALKQISGIVDIINDLSQKINDLNQKVNDINNNNNSTNNTSSSNNTVNNTVTANINTAATQMTQSEYDKIVECAIKLKTSYDPGKSSLDSNAKAEIKRLAEAYAKYFAGKKAMGGIPTMIYVYGMADALWFASSKTEQEDLAKNLELATKRADGVANQLKSYLGNMEMGSEMKAFVQTMIHPKKLPDSGPAYRATLIWLGNPCDKEALGLLRTAMDQDSANAVLDATNNGASGSGASLSNAGSGNNQPPALKEVTPGTVVLSTGATNNNSNQALLDSLVTMTNSLEGN